ncbi:MAG: 16S rRNA (guanine(527)-N(7))-methyltransferase RsmG [Steroidobacteraceae bacterium]
MLQSLVHDAAALGVALTEHDAARLRQLLEELMHWNQRFNLTGLADLESMITHHVLDSLAVHRYLHGLAIADVGTGAGFPGLPLALANPERRFTLIDSSGKKIRFVSHAVRSLGLMNAKPLQARVETLRPERPFDTVLARAFAPLSELLGAVTPLCGSETRVLAMKGKWPKSELEGLPRLWRVADSHFLTVPGLAESRCLIVLMSGVAH